MKPGLGRKFKPDFRDEEHPMRPLLSSAGIVKRPYAYWHGSMFLDQGFTPRCVDYSAHHLIQTGKIRPPSRYPYWEPGSLYDRMQEIDEWEGTDYDGTSVRAGAKVLQERGFIESYKWAWDLETVVDCLTDFGPVWVGTDWTEDMFTPDNRGFIRATGANAGGHAYILDGASRKHGKARMKNSWNRSWGNNGRAWIPFEDLEQLLLRNGEACIVVEADR